MSTYPGTASTPGPAASDTDAAWEQWGARDPYYGVLTDPRFRTAALTPEGMAEFFASGARHVNHVVDVIRRSFDREFVPRRVLDFGCGVGRLVIPFAACAESVMGMDVSTSMLAEASRNCEARGLLNVTLVRSDDMLSRAEGDFDLVHSYIVLQHIEIARGRELFARLVGKVRPGAFGAIQVTTGWDFHAATFGQPPPSPPPPASPSPTSLLRSTVRGWLGQVQKQEPIAPVVANLDPEMQMNFYNLSELVFILQRAGIERVHSELIDHGGVCGAFLFFRRDA